jgi:hypothetical protein
LFFDDDAVGMIVGQWISFVEEGILKTEDDSVDCNCRILNFGFAIDSFTSSFNDRESKHNYFYSLIMKMIIYYSILFVVSFL